MHLELLLHGVVFPLLDGAVGSFTIIASPRETDVYHLEVLFLTHRETEENIKWSQTKQC